MVREHLVLPVPTSPFSGGSDASHKITGVGMKHSVIVSSPKSEHIVMPIVSYPSSHSGWHTSPGESVSLPSQLPALPFSGNVTMHCEGSTGTHVAGVNSPSAEHEDVITPDNSNVSRHPGVHDVPAASVVTSLQPPAANFFVPSYPFSGFVTAHVMSCTQVAAVKTPSAEHEDVEPSFSEYPVLHAGVHDAPGASVFTLLQLLPPVPAVPLPGFVTVHVMSFTHVAAVSVPAEHDVVVCPAIVDSEYPSLHAGTHDSPVASTVTPAQLASPSPAQPLVGSEISVHDPTGEQTTFVSVPSALQLA
jgi:hypothetical protein